MYEQYKAGRAKHHLPYRDEVNSNRIQLFREHYFVFNKAESILKQSFVQWDPIYSAFFYQRLTELWQIYDKAGCIVDFLSSSDFKNTPFLSIRAKLMAADIVNHRTPKLEESLLTDFDIVATILPYSDVFATENYMAELIKKTKVGDEYGCRVFTMRQKQELLDVLSER